MEDIDVTLLGRKVLHLKMDDKPVNVYPTLDLLKKDLDQIFGKGAICTDHANSLLITHPRIKGKILVAEWEIVS
jgi:hypothetical protein